MVATVDKLMAGLKGNGGGMPPQMLVALPAMMGFLKWAARSLPEPQLVGIITSARDMCDGWLDAMQEGGAEDGDAARGSVADTARDQPAERD